MKEEPVIAIVGATGIIGNEIISVLNEREFTASEVRLFSSEHSVGEVYQVCGEEAAVEMIDGDSFNDVDIALFAMESSLAEELVPQAVEAGAFVIDSSSYWRMDPKVPLVIPEVNPESVTEETKIISSPSCCVAQLAPVLKVIHDQAGLKRAVISTYQGVSGAGKYALDELWNQTRAIYSQEEIEQEAFPHQIAFNCIPHVDVFLESGYTKEEDKIVNETRKVLGLPDLKITATAVRVPVFHCYGESLNVELEKELLPEALNGLLEKAEGIKVLHSYSDYPMHCMAAGADEIFVGRVRRDFSVPHGLDLWIVSDNVRKGAALNLVQIAELLVERFE